MATDPEEVLAEMRPCLVEEEAAIHSETEAQEDCGLRSGESSPEAEQVCIKDAGVCSFVEKRLQQGKSLSTLGEWEKYLGPRVVDERKTVLTLVGGALKGIELFAAWGSLGGIREFECIGNETGEDVDPLHMEPGTRVADHVDEFKNAVAGGVLGAARHRRLLWSSIS